MNIEYRWTESQFIRLALYDFELGPRSGRGKATMWLVIFTLIGLLAINIAHRGFTYSVWDLVLIAAGLCWYTLRGTLMKRMFKRAFKRSGMDGVNLKYSLDEEQLKIQVAAKPEHTLEWKQIKRVIRTQEGFLVYPGPRWLPAARIEDGRTTEELAAFLQRKVVDYRDKSQHKLKLKD
ncbi:hypothetical protein [Marinospirillum insulare]|uniref:YcxB-like protein n=1 Tax=Marinospirillum insulare TaxID=217169 RepID=A0ABQ6A132_9GAMM|nr:hypothetical protein [Marinospirillum insulare]GLR63839.1 hypothetical protein GCM10007878_12760 [Marinospirillum insulare]